MNRMLSLKTGGLALILVSGVAQAAALPVEISTCASLENIKQGPVVLVNDIDCSGVSDFKPIGAAVPFKGSFDGQGFKVKDLRINADPREKDAGLFASLQDAVIRDLRLENITVRSGGAAAGALAGRASRTNIYRVSVARADVQGVDAGTLAGVTENVEIEQVAVDGNVAGFDAVGGFIGHAIDTNIRDSYSRADVVFKSLAAKGRIEEVPYLGGFIGVLEARNIPTRVMNTFAAGRVEAGNSNAVTGSWVGMQNKFGLVRSEVLGSFFDRDVTPQVLSSGLPALALNTPMMYTRESFQGFDFSRIWAANSGAGYPHLQWEDRPSVIFTDRKTVVHREDPGRQGPGMILARNEKAGLVLALVEDAQRALVPALFIRRGQSFAELTRLAPPDFRIPQDGASHFAYKGAIADDGTVSLLVSLPGGDTNQFPAVYRYLVHRP